VGGVVVDDRVNGLVPRDLALERVEEADELLVPVAGHVAAEHGAIEHVERREQRRRPVPLVVVVPIRPFFIGRPGWVRSSAWISDF